MPETETRSTIPHSFHDKEIDVLTVRPGDKEAVEREHQRRVTAVKAAMSQARDQVLNNWDWDGKEQK